MLIFQLQVNFFLSVSSQSDELVLTASLPTTGHVEEHTETVITCTAPSTSLITLVITRKSGSTLLQYFEETHVLTRTITLNREFNEAVIQCKTDSGLHSNTVSYTIKCK